MFAKKKHYFLIINLLIISSLLLIGQRIVIGVTPVEELNNKIQSQKQKLEEVRKKIEEYQKLIATKQAEVNSLKQQLNVLDDKIVQAELNLKANELNLNTVSLEIQSITLEIQNKDTQIERAKEKIAEILRQLYLADQQSLLEILVLHEKLGDFFDQLNYLQELQNTLQANVDYLQKLKVGLENQQQDLSNKKIKLLDIKKSLETSQSLLTATRDEKDLLIKQTKQSENRYQTLLAQAVAEQASANIDIQKMEAQLRQKIAKEKEYAKLSDTNFIWPVSPTLGITAYFHDPDYPFRKYFEHPAIDIRAKQGTPIKAGASGYVGRAKDGGLGYSYIMLIHGNNFSTVYGHVSKIYVTEGNFVTKGQIIGLSGGLPGTPGAGRLTTGAHLHFELRYNGLPTDPLEYLP